MTVQPRLEKLLEFGHSLSHIRRIPADFLGAAAVILVWLAALGSLTRVRSALIVGTDNRISTSKVAALSWTIAVGFVMAYFLFLQWAGTMAAECGPPVLDGEELPACTLPGLLGAEGLSSNYLLLLGAPFAALLGAQAITSAQVADGTQQKTESATTPSASQAVQDDAGQGDLADSQYLLFNLLAGLYFLIAFISTPLEGLPVIPTALVGLTSLSAATYVGKKFASTNALDITALDPPNPVAGEVLRIHGRNFLPDGAVTAKVTIRGTPVTPTTVSDSLITVSMPPHNPTSNDVTVITEAGSTKSVSLPADQSLLGATLTPSPATPGKEVSLRLPRDPTLPTTGVTVELHDDSGYRQRLEPTKQADGPTFTFTLPPSTPAPTDAGKKVYATLLRGELPIAQAGFVTHVPTLTVTPASLDPGTPVVIGIPAEYSNHALTVQVDNNDPEPLPPAGTSPSRVTKLGTSESAVQTVAMLSLRKGEEVLARAQVTLLAWPVVTAAHIEGKRFVVEGRGLVGSSAPTITIHVGGQVATPDLSFPTQLSGPLPTDETNPTVVVTHSTQHTKLWPK